MNVTCFAFFLEFIGYHDIWPIDIVSNDLCSNNTADDCSSMNTDSHV